MIALMETLSYSLNVQVGDIKTSGTIIERERTLKNLRSKAKLAQEEQGTNTLYLCFGFIYWREQERESSPWLKAPLLMMPVSLGLKSLNAPYTLSRYDDEIEVNPTLDYLFNTEYHIDLPTFELKNRDSFSKLIEKALNNLGNGGRGIGNIVESLLINPLARYLFDEGISENVKIVLNDIDAENMPYALSCTYEALK